jgi:type I restriction enzyme S subunit
MTYPNLPSKAYKELMVPVVPLSDQRRIAAFFKAGLEQNDLPELPVYLDEQRRIVSRIEELAAKAEEARRLRQQAVEELDTLLLSALTHLRLPQGSATKKISQCSTMSTGTTPPSDRSDYYGGTIQWYTPGDLEYQQQLGASSRTLSEQAFTERKARMFGPGTVLLVAIGGSLGKVALTHERCSANQQITGIRFSTDILPEYGFWWMRRLGKDLVAAAPQATLPIINQERIGVFQISVPSIPEQRSIVAYLDDLQAKVDTLKKLQSETAAGLDALMPSILSRAFRGEL